MISDCSGGVNEQNPRLARPPSFHDSAAQWLERRTVAGARIVGSARQYHVEPATRHRLPLRLAPVLESQLHAFVFAACKRAPLHHARARILEDVAAEFRCGGDNAGGLGNAKAELFGDVADGTPRHGDIGFLLDLYFALILKVHGAASFHRPAC